MRKKLTEAAKSLKMCAYRTWSGNGTSTITSATNASVGSTAGNALLLDLDRNVISILETLRSLQSNKCDGRTGETGCFQFCKHCIAQLDSVIAANSTMLQSSSAFCQILNSNNNLKFTQQCTESNNKVLLFLKLVSATLSLHSLREVPSSDSYENNPSSSQNHRNFSDAALISTSDPTDDSIGKEDPIFSSAYLNHHDNEGLNTLRSIGTIEKTTQHLYELTNTAIIENQSHSEALLDHQLQHHPSSSTNSYTGFAFPYLFQNSAHEAGTDTAMTGTVVEPGDFDMETDSVEILGPSHDEHGLVLSYQPNSVLTLEMPGNNGNSMESHNVSTATRNGSQIQSGNHNQGFDASQADLPMIGQEIEISVLCGENPDSGPQLSQFQIQIPPLNLGSLLKKNSKNKLPGVKLRAQQQGLKSNPKPKGEKIKKEEAHQHKTKNSSGTLAKIVSQRLPQNNHFTCSVCNASVHSKYALSKHRQLHKGQPASALASVGQSVATLKCHYCPNTYSLAQELNEHEGKCALINTKKKYNCTICDKEYLSRESVRRHEKTHSGIKPFKCDKCGCAYYERCDLTKHQKRYKDSINCSLDHLKKNSGNNRSFKTEITFGNGNLTTAHPLIHPSDFPATGSIIPFAPASSSTVLRQ